MRRRQIKYRFILSLAAIALVLLASGIGVPLLWKVRVVSGTVRDATGQPLSGATVRVKATDIATRTDAAGRFTLGGFTPAFRLPVTAWQEGYYVAGAGASPWKSTVDIVLAPYAVPDNTNYSWVLPAAETRSAVAEWFTQTGLSLAVLVSFNRAFLPLAARLSLGCRDCHGQTIYDQWAASTHALGAQNARFLTMYNGTDVNGNQSPPTRYGYNRDYGSFPLRPDPNQPYYGPGYKLDFPNTAGNCAACHLPSAAIEQPYGIDPNQVAGVDAQGTHCDFCHKIVAVKLDPATGRPYENMPGILSLTLMRPSPEPQLFFGPYDDVDVGPDTYLPLVKQSQLCAPCHNANFWGVPIYQSFAEWQASPYPAQGKTCQSCHMQPDGVTTNFAPGRGGLERDPGTIPTHNFPGAADETLLQNAVTMTSSTRREGDTVIVEVSITNDQTGHHVPTDSPLRQLILLVQATTADGKPLAQLDGPTVPEWGGVGDPGEGYYAELPGTAYAKVLQELWTEITPTGAYWNPTRVLSDNRIPALASATSTYTFAAPDEEEVRVEVTLLFRRAFIALMDQKGWDVPDIIMAQQSLAVDRESKLQGDWPCWVTYQPRLIRFKIGLPGGGKHHARHTA
ncbi:MAG: carboxypeptidase regulatory-like domain-containing protein [Deinococcus sp.]|nr:carboxypeptidase regulatory-like domain-containing protein [Deinococcus sp.]